MSHFLIFPSLFRPLLADCSEKSSRVYFSVVLGGRGRGRRRLLLIDRVNLDFNVQRSTFGHCLAPWAVSTPSLIVSLGKVCLSCTSPLTYQLSSTVCSELFLRTLRNLAPVGVTSWSSNTRRLTAGLLGCSVHGSVRHTLSGLYQSAYPLFVGIDYVLTFYRTMPMPPSPWQDCARFDIGSAHEGKCFTFISRNSTYTTHSQVL